MNVEDAEKYTEWLNDFRVTDGLGSSTRLLNADSERQWLLSGQNDKNVINFAVVSLEKDELIGNCGIMSIDHLNRLATVGLFIGEEENRSKGYGAETLRLMLDFGFNYLNLNNIMLQLKSFNEGAFACYKKVGFKECGRRRESCFLDGKYYDEIQMDMLAREFEGGYIRNRNI
jgi:RimJ/RimL family protein N-acetyltransferase